MVSSISSTLGKVVPVVSELKTAHDSQANIYSDISDAESQHESQTYSEEQYSRSDRESDLEPPLNKKNKLEGEAEYVKGSSQSLHTYGRGTTF